MSLTQWNRLVRWTLLTFLIALSCGTVQSQDSGSNQLPWNRQRFHYEDLKNIQKDRARQIQNLFRYARPVPEGYERVVFRGTLRTKNVPDHESQVDVGRGREIRVYWTQFLPSSNQVNIGDYVEVRAIRRIGGNDGIVAGATIRALRPSVPAPAVTNLYAGARASVLIRGRFFPHRYLTVELPDGRRVNVTVPRRISGDQRDLWRDSRAFNENFRIGARVRIVIHSVARSPRDQRVIMIYAADVIVR